jgi:hypothetical protein
MGGRVWKEPRDGCDYERAEGVYTHILPSRLFTEDMFDCLLSVERLASSGTLLHGNTLISISTTPAKLSFARKSQSANTPHHGPYFTRPSPAQRRQQ